MTVGLSKTVILIVLTGYLFGNFRQYIIIQYILLLDRFSVISNIPVSYNTGLRLIVISQAIGDKRIILKCKFKFVHRCGMETCTNN